MFENHFKKSTVFNAAKIETFLVIFKHFAKYAGAKSLELLLTTF